jgi:photosystem II stability/assembly factor-like uncharacterized protein
LIKTYKIILPILLASLSFIDGQAQENLPNHFKFKQSTGTNPLPPSNSVSQMVTQDSIIWIGTSKGLAKSTNYGRSWINFKDIPEFANDGIYALDIHNDTIWTSTGYSKEKDKENIPTGSGYTYSTNGGLSWNYVGQTLDQRGDSIITNYGINDSVYILPIVVPEQNVTYDISLSPGIVWIASWASGLRKSTDNGSSWIRTLLPLDNMNSIKPTDTLWTYAADDTLRQRKLYFRFDPRGIPQIISNNNLKVFSVLAIDNDTIWCGTAGGINKSTDGGISWQKFTHQNQERPILGDWVIAIKEQRFQSKTRIWTTNWLADLQSEKNGVSYTEDGGHTWINLLHGVKSYDFAFKDSIAYIATAEGLYRTDDGGLSFNRSNLITDPETRQVITTSSVFSVSVINDTVFAGTSDGIVSTIDNADNNFGSVWKIYRRYEMVGSNKTSYAYPNPFSPDDQYTRIHYSTGGNDASVSIEIFDFGMNRVRTVIQNALRSGKYEHDELWNGRDDVGRYATNGVYFYRIRIANEDPLWGKIMVLR